MKFVFSLRSQMAYDFLEKRLRASNSFPNLDIQKRNVENLSDLEDAIDFFEADVYVIDSKVEGSNELIEKLKNENLVFEFITGEVREVVPILIEKYGEKEEVKNIYYEREELQQVEIQEKIIEKEIFLTNYQAIPSKVVVVGSLYGGAGSTLLATNLARMIAARNVDVAYVEHPHIQPYMFDYLQIHADESIEYVDLAKEVKEHGVVYSKGKTYKKYGVKWHVIDSRKPSIDDFTYENLMTLSHGIQSTVLIIDISNHWLDKGIQKFLYLADSILMCVEPDPIKNDWSLIQTNGVKTKEKEIMDLLTQNEQLQHYQYVLMKFVHGVDIRLIKEMLHKRPIATIPYIEYGDLKRTLFNSKLIYDVGDYKSYFEENLIQAITAFVPKDFVKLESKGESLFTKFFKKK